MANLFSKLFGNTEPDSWAEQKFQVEREPIYDVDLMYAHTVEDVDKVQRRVQRRTEQIIKERQARNVPATAEERNPVNIDELIHKDIDEVIAELLKESEIDLPIPYDNDESERLTKLLNLGFSRVKDVQDYRTKMGRYSEQKARIDRINYYKQTYPFNKFITEEAINAICNTYGLVLSDTSNYIGEIPEKNQKEIISFKIKAIDAEVIERDARPNMTFWHMSKRLNRSNDEPEYYITETRRPFGTGHTFDSDMFISGGSLQIVAPTHMFDTHSVTKVGNKLYNITDPIVLQPVKGGYLIVSAWGYEAKDPSVLNEINN